MSRDVTVGSLEYPPVLRALNAAAWVGEALGTDLGRVDDSILDAARAATGLTDWGDDAFLDPFHRLCGEVERASAGTPDGHAYTPLGRVITRQAFVRAVSNRLWMTEYVKRHPEVLNERIERPIFVLGFPRTGTTLLQNLLAQDHQRRGLEFWELTTPVPVHDDPKIDERRRVRATYRMLQAGYVVAPEMRTVHEIRVRSLEECWPLFYNSFSAFNFDLQSGFRGYGDWLLQRDMTGPYREYRLQLQILQHRARLAGRPDTQLVLKCPEHLWFLDPLLKVFPDACIVWTHRDPASSVASYCSLISLARRMVWGRVDGPALGRDVTERFALGVSRAMRTRDRSDPARFFDVRFSDLVKDPTGMVRDILAWFDLPAAPGFDLAMDAYMATERADHRGAHKYDPALYGLDADRVRHTFRAYSARFGLGKAAAALPAHAGDEPPRLHLGA